MLLMWTGYIYLYIYLDSPEIIISTIEEKDLEEIRGAMKRNQNSATRKQTVLHLQRVVKADLFLKHINLI